MKNKELPYFGPVFGKDANATCGPCFAVFLLVSWHVIQIERKARPLLAFSPSVASHRKGLLNPHHHRGRFVVGTWEQIITTNERELFRELLSTSNPIYAGITAEGIDRLLGKR